MLPEEKFAGVFFPSDLEIMARAVTSVSTETTPITQREELAELAIRLFNSGVQDLADLTHALKSQRL